MQNIIRPAGMIGLSLVLLAGCLPSGPKPGGNSGQPVQVEATPGQLVEIIIDMSHDMDKYGDGIERHIYTDQLAQMGPTALAPLLDYMAAPDTDQTARLFILQCVGIHLTPMYLPNLTPMLASEDQVVRAIGATALGSVDHEAVVPLLKQARNDPQPRVAFSAMSSLAIHGDEEARSELRQMYLDGATMGEIPVEHMNLEIVRALAAGAQPEDLPVLLDALNQPYLEVNQRTAIVRALGRIGDKSAIPLLEQSIDLQTEPTYGQLVRDVIAAIEARGDRA